MSRLDKLLKLLEADENDAFVLYGIAQEHATADRHGEAVAFYRRCIAADPNYLYAYYHGARSLIESAAAADAVQMARDGIERARAAGDEKALAELLELKHELEAAS